jgi:hypothetical protein
MKDSGQLTFTTMGGDSVTVPVRGKHYIQPRGYAAPPGTGPAGETCGSCAARQRVPPLPQVSAQRRLWGHTRRSDILARSPACAKWEKANG